MRRQKCFVVIIEMDRVASQTVREGLRLNTTQYVMFLLGISENKATRKEFAIYRSNVVVPTGPGFFSLKTFCFAKMTSRVFNIVLEGSFQRSCYEPGSTMLKKRDVIEAKLKV